MITLLLIGIFLTELVKYGIWFRNIQGLRLKRLGLGSILTGLYVVLIIFGIINVETLLLLWSVVAVIIFVLMLDCDKSRWLYGMQAFFMTLCISEAIVILIRLYIGRMWNDFFEIKVNYLLNNAVVIIIFCIWTIVKRSVKKLEKKYEMKVRWFVLIMFMINGIAILFVVNGFQNFAQYIKNEKISKISMIMSLMSFIFFACLIIMVSYIWAQNKKYKLYLEKDALLLKTQENMYEAMLAKNEEVRCFRHDIQNHLMCLEELINSGDMLKVSDYVKGMNGKLKPNENKVYMVGNSVIDVVLNYYIALLDNNVKVRIVGNCSHRIKMNDVELCTVVSNLIQNAVEALNRLELDDKSLEVEFIYHNGYILMRVKNTMSHINIKISDGKSIFMTSKIDEEQHGIGIRNAEETLLQNGGMLKISIKHDEFVAIAMFPIVENK